MKKLMLLTMLTFVPSAVAEEPFRLRIIVDMKPTAAAQLAHARALIGDIDVAPNDAERQRVVAIAMMNLESILTRWPDDTRAAAEVYALQYDIAMRSQMPRNAADVMAKAERLPLAASEKVTVARKKAVALAMSGQAAGAEQAFATAEEGQQHASAFERQALLQDRARFAVSQGHPAEAAKHLRKLAKMPLLDSATRMTVVLQMLEHSVSAGNRNGARADRRELQRLYDDAKSKTPASEGEVELLKIVADALEHHRGVE